MAMKQLTWMYTLVVVSIVGTHGEYINGDLVHFNSVITMDKYGGASVYNEFAPIDLVNCIDTCKRIKACEFINYFNRFKRCTLIETSNSTTQPNIQQQVGQLYGDKSEWNPTSVPVECATCTDYEECVTSSPTNHTCVKIGCGKARYIGDTTQHGNLYGIDNKLKYTCNNNNNMSVTSVCQSDELWTNKNFTCVPECVATPNVQYVAGAFYYQPLTYYISPDKLNKQEAETYCQATCGQLIEVYTVEKFQYFVGVLQALNENNQDEFYIDAVHHDGDHVWYTSHGNVVPKTLDIWNNEAAYDGGSPCATFDAEDGYNLDDKSCTWSRRFICERV